MTEWPAFVCPDDHRPLVPEHEVLVCQKCSARYPIVRGIPRFVETGRYAEAFGDQWARYRQSQLDSYTGLGLSRERLSRCMGAQFDHLEGRHVLEAGCGAGRFTEVLLDQGACVTSVDLSAAADVNRENFPDPDRHRVAQADILAMPFEDTSFEIVICLGVVQHTPDPEQTIKALAAKVQPGGLLVIDHYPPDPARFTTVRPIARAIIKRIPSATRFRVTESLVNFFLPLHRRLHASPARKILNRFSPILHYYNVYPQASDSLQREWALLDTHDALADWFKHRRSAKQIRATLEDLGLEEIWCEPGGNGVEARATAPANRQAEPID